MRVKRVLAGEPFTLREKIGTSQPRSVDKRAPPVRCRSVEFGSVLIVPSFASLAFGIRRRD